MKADRKEILEKINDEGIIVRRPATFFKSKYNVLPGELYISPRRVIFLRTPGKYYLPGLCALAATFFLSSMANEPLIARILFWTLGYFVSFLIISMLEAGKSSVVHNIDMNSIRFFSKECTGFHKDMVITLRNGSTIKFSMNSQQALETCIKQLVRSAA